MQTSFKAGKLTNQYQKAVIRSETLFKKIKTLSHNLSSNSPPSVFVGSQNYPNLNVGILSPPERTKNAWIYDSQNYWALNDFPISQIMFYRSNLINSRFKAKPKETNKFVNLSQEIALTQKPVDLEIELKKKVNIKIDYDKISMPMGPRAPLKNVRITSNPRVHTKVEKVFSDTDLKANNAINYLYKNNFDEHFISKILSIGALGLKKSRKIVPTRWSITATDDSLAKNIISELKNYNTIDNYQLYFGNFMGNYYLILLFPEIINYELFEMYLPGSSWHEKSGTLIATDSESHFGRKAYASNTVGGYYAARLAVLEKLKELRRQASILCLRFETPEYWASLGVWVVRESARKTIHQEPIIFDNKEGMLRQAHSIIKKKLNYDIGYIIKQSKLLNQLKNQIKLSDFIYLSLYPDNVSST